MGDVESFNKVFIDTPQVFYMPVVFFIHGNKRITITKVFMKGMG